MRNRCALWDRLLLAVCALPLIALAQDYPSKPARILVPYAPGGPTELVSRMVGDGLSERDKLAAAGLLSVGGTAEQFDAHLRSEIQRRGAVIRARNIKVEQVAGGGRHRSKQWKAVRSLVRSIAC